MKYLDSLPTETSIAALTATHTRQHRSVLLPPVLNNPYFKDLLDAFDEVFDDFETKLIYLRNIRNPYLVDSYLEEKIAKTEMLDLADWPIPPHMNAMLSNLDVEEGDLVALWNISKYWRQKRRKAEDFAAFCGINLEKLNG